MLSLNGLVDLVEWKGRDQSVEGQAAFKGIATRSPRAALTTSAPTFSTTCAQDAGRRFI
jgi:hypothetical protein